MKKFFSCKCLLLLLAATFVSCSSPSLSQTAISRKALKYYNEGVEHLNWDRTEEAEVSFLEALKIEPAYIDALKKLSQVYIQTRQYEKAYQMQQKLIGLGKADLFEFARICLASGNSLDSTARLQRYEEGYKALLKTDVFNNPSALKEPGLLLASLGFAIDYSKKNLLDFRIEITPLNSNINTAAREYFPTLTADGSKLYFTRHVTVSNYLNEDIFVSEWNGKDWGVPASVGSNVNTLSNEAAASISPDGRKLYFTICENNIGFGGCDIWVSERLGNTWLTPKNLGAAINTSAKETQPCISGDGRSLYFVSSRKGGLGMLDIWVSHLLSDGTWSVPENPGVFINTPFDEQRPFIHPDNHTLYFSSDGHPGFGHADIFMSKKNENGNWQKPLNLGLPINSYENEEGIYVSLDGSTAYFASDRFHSGKATKRNYDLYNFNIAPSYAPDTVTYVKGIVYADATKKRLAAEILFIDLKSGKTVNSTVSDESSGEYLLCLETGKDYAMNISKSGYLFFSQNFSLRGIGRGESFKLDAALKKIQAEEKTVLRNIFFETNSASLKPESTAELEILLKFLRENPAVKIEIEGHTDNAGTPEYNKSLSEQRAKAVYDYLLGKGIEKSRLSYKGYGETQPVASNDNEDGRAKNRRTEFRIT
ncbi:MAG TPA: OmpA family protein, partial [Chitinophagales bacterium]|nr:OmpA family protein [Chitinophagales bacterium]